MIDTTDLIERYLASTQEAQSRDLESVANPSQSPVGGTSELVEPVPTDIVFSYWQEEDGSWSGYSELLGVTAVAKTEAELFVEASHEVSEFWDILNKDYETLSDNLRALLCLRFQNLKFTRTSAS